MASTMRAAVFDADKRRLSVQEVPVPTPGPDEVLVRVEACGICLSDVHLIDGTLPPVLRSVIPGHESSGVVESVGDLVKGWKPGDEVILTGGRQCRECRYCVIGRPEDCLDRQVMGVAYHGAWAEYVVVPYFSLAPKPPALPFEQAAIIADAVSTPYAGLIDRGGLRMGESVGLWGIGGLGVHAVQIARLAGAAPIIALDPSPKARERALAAGADHVLDPTEPTRDIRSRIKALTGGRGLDLAVDLAGANVVLAQAQKCLARSGRLVMVGLSMDPLALAPGMYLGVLRQSVLGHIGYTKRHMEEVASLVGYGRLDLSRSISDILPLEDVVDGVRRLAEKDGDPIRLIVRPHA